jgi:hypothetical protein
LLDVFKAQESERPEVIHPLLNNSILRNLVIAWSMTPVSFATPKGEVPEEEAARWRWLWQGVRFDRDDIANALKLDRTKVGRLVDRASAFRLIYPDGTANELALQFIRQEIAKGLKGKGKPKAPAGAA